jgi:phage terminase large subunit
MRSVCIREIQRSLEQSAKRLIEDKIASLGVASMFDIQHEKIITPGGGLIIFQGMQNHTADSIKSLEGFQRAWVEEAQSLSQRSLDLLRPTIRSVDSELWFSWNPDKESDPVDQFLRVSPPPNAIVVQANHTDNPWFPEILKQEMEWDKRRDYDKYAHVWLGEYANATEGRVFKHWRVDDFDTPTNAQFYHGADWGFSIDPTALVRAFVQDRTLYIDAEAYGVGVDIDDTPELFDAVPSSRKWRIIADSARPETISYMRRQGYDIVGAKKGKGSVEDGVEHIKGYHEVVIHPRCKHTIDEFKMYSYKLDRLTGEPTPVLEDRHNHMIDALRYALEPVMRNKGTPSAVSIPGL